MNQPQKLKANRRLTGTAVRAQIVSREISEEEDVSFVRTTRRTSIPR